MTARVLTPPFDQEARETAAQALAEGLMMTYPTETSYALGGNALDDELCARVHTLKGRPERKSLLLLIASDESLEHWVQEIHPAARVLMDRFWPGPLTLVFRASANVPPHLVDARGTIALRWTPNRIVSELWEIGGVPLIGTSANRSGQPHLLRAGDVLSEFGEAIEVAIDGGPAPGGLPSTLLDTTTMPFRLLREGALHKTHVQATLVETHIDAVPG